MVLWWVQIRMSRCIWRPVCLLALQAAERRSTGHVHSVSSCSLWKEMRFFLLTCHSAHDWCFPYGQASPFFKRRIFCHVVRTSAPNRKFDFYRSNYCVCGSPLPCLPCNMPANRAVHPPAIISLNQQTLLLRMPMIIGTFKGIVPFHKKKSIS